MVPYIFFGILMIILMFSCNLRIDILDYSINGILLSKDSRHLWFVLMLFEVFVFFWIIQKLQEKVNLPKWSLLIVSLFFYISANHFPYFLQISSAFRFQFWFTFGYIFILYKENILDFVNSYILGVVILFVVLFYERQEYYKIPFLSTIVAVAGIMLFYNLSRDFKGIANNGLFQLVSKNSYGIYLYHVVIIYLLFYLMRDVSLSPYVLSSFIFLTSLGGSILLTILTRYLGLGFIIGEQ